MFVFFEIDEEMIVALTQTFQKAYVNFDSKLFSPFLSCDICFAPSKEKASFNKASLAKMFC